MMTKTGNSQPAAGNSGGERLRKDKGKRIKDEGGQQAIGSRHQQQEESVNRGLRYSPRFVEILKLKGNFAEYTSR